MTHSSVSERSAFFPTIFAAGMVCLAMAGCGASPSAVTTPMQASAPVFAPGAGTYINAQTVTITDATAGATIFYTTDGSAPTTASKVYSAPLVVAATTTLQAIATASGEDASNVTSAVFTITPPAATPTFSLAAGTYVTTQMVTIADATASATIFYTTDGSTPTTASKTYNAPIAISATTTLQAIATAPESSASNVASAVFTITPPAATPTFSVAAGTYNSTQTVNISDATTGASIFYTTDGSTPTTASKVYSASLTISATTTLEAIATAPGASASNVASALFTITPPAATPNFSVAAGTYNSTQNVSISDATTGASIFYTTDGSTPTTASKMYNAPIAISATTTLQAIATASGSSASNVASAVFTITPPAATPTFSVAAGTYNSTQSVNISDTTAGATIFYTTDGSTPTTSSKAYSAPVTISATTTLQAVATAPGSSLSSVASEIYTIAIASPTFTPAAGTYTSVQSVTIATLSSGAQIFYTTDGSVPTAYSTLYSGPVSVVTTETISAIATLNSLSSPLASSSYEIDLPAASISAYAGSGQSIQEGSGFTEPLEVQVLNAVNKPVANVTVNFSPPATSASISFSSTSCTTDSTGLCSVTVRAGVSAGTYTVIAATGTLNAAFTLTNTGFHSYVVTVATDTTTGVAANCFDQPTNPGAANANCSLRDALAAASLNASSTGDATITFAQTTETTITLANGSLALPSFTTVQGATSGAGATLTNLITIDGNQTGSVFTEDAAVAQAALNNFTITGGSAVQVGGGIYMLGSLSVNNSSFVSNQSGVSGGAISNQGGNLTVFGSTFNANSAVTGYGGGIDNHAGGTVTVSNSTFSGNQGNNGGAIYSSGTVTITDSTLVGNTAAYGAGIYNRGAITVSNSIVNGNTNEDCGGVYCAPLWAYVVFSSATPSVVDSNTITIAFKDSLGNSFSQSVSYGPFSSPASVASGFGPYFYYNYSGLDTTPITGESFGDLLVISPENGATLLPFTITNPGQSFTATETSYPPPLSINHNLSGISAGLINLSPLGENGGPTQTIVPLSGSEALCVISPSTETGTDQRGQPRAVQVGATTCQDAGAVQTAN